MSLPLPAVERLFDRLNATYGRDFVGKFEGIDLGSVKTSWAHELDGFTNRLADIAWALENLPERAPNVIEFRNLCRRAPALQLPRIEVEPASKERVQAELQKLTAGSADQATRGRGNLDWAHRIVAREASGVHSSSSLPLKMAREALARAGVSA